MEQGKSQGRTTPLEYLLVCTGHVIEHKGSGGNLRQIIYQSGVVSLGLIFILDLKKKKFKLTLSEMRFKF